jgi:hypothetical protein
VGAVAAYYRRILGPTSLAAIAALLYALDDARATTAGFIANRNVLIAAFFGVLGLLCHDRARRDRSRTAAILAPLLLLAALFTKEEGLGTCAYLLAYGLFLDAQGPWRGCLALWPYATVVFVWRSLRSYWGYGVVNMGLYVDPIAEPARFALAAIKRVPILLLGQWTPIPSEIVIPLSARATTVLWAFALVFLVVLAYAMGPLLARDRLARFWATGMILATLPVSATFPMDRLYTFLGIGAFGLLAQYWMFVFGKPSAVPPTPLWRIPARGLAWFFVFVHAVLAPLLLPFRAGNPVGLKWVEQRLYVRYPLGPSCGDQTILIVNAPSSIHAGFLVLERALAGQPVPQHTHVLASAVPPATIRRLGERTLAIRRESGYFNGTIDQLYRNEHRQLSLGEKVELSAMTVEITELTADGQPAEATFSFHVPLESPSLFWLCFRGQGFEPFTPPAIGEECEIPLDWRAAFWPGPVTAASGEKTP